MIEIVWGAFLALFLGLLVLDLSVLHRESATLSVKQALFWTAVWICVAMSFTVPVYGLYEYRWFGFEPGQGVVDGTDAVVQFITGYLLEWSLSVDNIFVMALIFAYLKIPTHYQYRVLFWGIVGAIVLRGLMIAAGTALLHHFDWMFYVFGLILLVSALRMLRNGDDEPDLEQSFPARLVRRFVPVVPGSRPRTFLRAARGQLVRDAAVRGARHGRTHGCRVRGRLDPGDPRGDARPVPGLHAPTRSRSSACVRLYFAVAGLMAMFRYLKYSLVLILAFVGMKMLLVSQFHVPNLISLGIILGTLGIGIVASIWATRRETRLEGE